MQDVIVLAHGRPLHHLLPWLLEDAGHEVELVDLDGALGAVRRDPAPLVVINSAERPDDIAPAVSALRAASRECLIVYLFGVGQHPAGTALLECTVCIHGLLDGEGVVAEIDRICLTD